MTFIQDHAHYLDKMIYKTKNISNIESTINEYTVSLIDPIPFITYQGIIWAMKMTNEWNDISIAWGNSNFYFAFFWSTTA